MFDARIFMTIALALVASGCQSSLDAPSPLPALDEPYFRCHVQPVLTKSCAAFACHGDAHRYLHLYARNRMRLLPAGLDRVGAEQLRNAKLSDDERLANFDAARAFIDTTSADASWLLRKPLEESAGGYYHRGALVFNQGNVFGSKDDPDLKILSNWAHGATEPNTACVEPGSDQ
jgi:hypothetical protein